MHYITEKEHDYFNYFLYNGYGDHYEQNRKISSFICNLCCPILWYQLCQRKPNQYHHKYDISPICCAISDLQG